MYIDWQLAVNGRNVVKNDKKNKKKQNECYGNIFIAYLAL
jgi:hypothetical protein